MPRTNRGIFAVNELPDLAERIQVSLLNVLEERDIQIRGYQLRLPLDLLLVASANPEDYTNRGRIITPLKDRFGAEIRTHYPVDLDAELALVRQEARLVAEVPEHLLEVLVRFARAVRESPAVDQRSGVSARFPIAAAETVAAAALRRAGLLGETDAVARIGDTESVTSTLRGKVEFESGEEGREVEVLAHLLRTATAETFRLRLAGLDLSGFVELVAGGEIIETGELVPADEILRQVGTVPGLAKALDRLGLGDAPSESEVAVRHRVRAGGTAPDPPAVQGHHRRRTHPLRQPMTARRSRYGVVAGRAGPARAALRRARRGGRDRRRGAGRRAACATRCGTCCARVPTVAVDSTTCASAPGGCAARRCAAAGSTARSPGRSNCSTRRWRPSGTRLRARTDDDARFAEAMLDDLPRSTARAVEELAEYTWTSPEAARLYRQILDDLRQDVVDQRFAGMKQALSDPAAQQAAAEMMRDLNDLLDRHARGEDTTDAFAEFMRRARRVLPGEPFQTPKNSSTCWPDGRRPGSG